MAVVLRNVAGHNWGWFSREDERMHLQTVDGESRKGPKSAKVWLEERGKRICQAANGKIDLRKLESKVKQDRANIEALWINFMIDNGWLAFELSSHLVTLTAYPNSHNRFFRTIDLKSEFPGAYSRNVLQPWDSNPPLIDLDGEHAALAVGRDQNLDNRNHIDLTKWIFQD